MQSKKPVRESAPPGAMSLGALFNRATHKTAMIAGKPPTIATAFALVLIWAMLGPFVGFSEAWQLTINTATTVITFLMVFIIQNGQNRDGLAIQIKLDELLRAQGGASDALFDLEELTEEELGELQKKYEALSAAAREKSRGGAPRRRHRAIARRSKA